MTYSQTAVEGFHQTHNPPTKYNTTTTYNIPHDKYVTVLQQTTQPNQFKQFSEEYGPSLHGWNIVDKV